MKGLDVARAYYEAYGKAMIADRFPDYADRIAVGLAGEGSECFGFDDEYSGDHDYGPSFCMWLTPADFTAIGPDLQRAYQELPKDFLGLPPRLEMTYGDGRVGVVCIDDFFRRQIGRADGRFTLREWVRIPESRLATVTNGQVFADPLGEFTEIRERLLAFYPEDVRLKKMASRAAVMGQAGQYNYARCMRRGETVAAQHTISEFILNTISMVYLLNRRYMPYYKWMHRGLQQLPVLGPEIGEKLRALAENRLDTSAWRDSYPGLGVLALNASDKNVLLIEEVCRIIADELVRQGLSSSGSSFMTDHGFSIMKRISDPDIKAMHLMEG